MAEYDILALPEKLAKDDMINCAYVGAPYTLRLQRGKYKLECWGAQGNGGKGGKGGYTSGVLNLTEAMDLFLRCGGQNGFNGGGSSGDGANGGGATDIRIEADTLNNRVIVAAGGGGSTSKEGGFGGGTNGGAGAGDYGGYGATQTSGGAPRTGYSNTKTGSVIVNGTTTYYYNEATGSGKGSFGQGGSGGVRTYGTLGYEPYTQPDVAGTSYSWRDSREYTYGSGGGGGWFGGSGSTSNTSHGGGGGSSFALTAATAGNAPDGYALNVNHYLTQAVLTAAANEGDGYIKITVLSVNDPPNAPTDFTVPAAVQTGRDSGISWSEATDPNGDAVSYQLERSVNGGEWLVIYTGVAPRYTDQPPEDDWITVQWRVYTKDSEGDYSMAVVGPIRSVLHNVDPSINGMDGDLGMMSTPPAYAFIVDDADSEDVLTITEMLDGVVLQVINGAVRNQEYVMMIPAEKFYALPAGPHTMKIAVTDGQSGVSERNITFTRVVSCIDFDYRAAVMDLQPDKVYLMLNYTGEAACIQVCNNYLDEQPAWEDIALSTAHVFANQEKTADMWAIAVRVKIDKSENYPSVSCDAPLMAYTTAAVQ